MKSFLLLPALAALASLASGCGYVKHVPPGQSLSAAMAKKAELVAVPAPPPSQSLALSTGQEPPLPETETVADAFTLGNLCMQQGHYPEAITAYRQAIKADPTFGEAWSNMAVAYQNLGQNDKALDAFRKYKMLASH